MASEKLVSSVVAPRKTVHVGTISRKSFDLDQKRDVQIVKPERIAMPGETVELSVSETKRLKSLGFLLDSAETPVSVGIGPSFSQEGHQAPDA